MRFALAEIRRAKLRFGLLVAAVALLVFLILFQQALAGSLLGQFVGGLEHLSAEALVYDADARRNVDASRVTPEQVGAVARVDGVESAGAIGEGSFTASIASAAAEDVTLFGYALDGPGAPTTLSEGRLPSGPDEAVLSENPSGRGVRVGETVRFLPGDATMTVVGLADDAQFNVQTTLYTSYEGYEDVVLATNPDARGVLPNLVGVEPAPGVEPAALAARITSSVNGVEALDKGTAVDSLPGVSSIRQSFAIILGLAFVVVMLLTGFFFLILTVQKTASLTLLRAAGASSRFLIGSLLLQVAVVTVGAIAVAVPLTYAAVASFSGDFTATVRPAVVVSTCVAIVVLAVIASIAALRRVAAIALRPPRRA